VQHAESLADHQHGVVEIGMFAGEEVAMDLALVGQAHVSLSFETGEVFFQVPERDLLHFENLYDAKRPPLGVPPKGAN
jgi:hypothetical protein